MGAGASTRRERAKPPRTKEIDELLHTMHKNYYTILDGSTESYVKKNVTAVYDDWLQGNCRLSDITFAKSTYDRIYIELYASLDNRQEGWGGMVPEERDACRANITRIANEMNTKAGRTLVTVTDSFIQKTVNEWAAPGSQYARGGPVNGERAVVEACINNYMNTDFKLVNLWPIERLLRDKRSSG